MSEHLCCFVWRRKPAPGFVPIRRLSLSLSLSLTVNVWVSLLLQHRPLLVFFISTFRLMDACVCLCVLAESGAVRWSEVAYFSDALSTFLINKQRVCVCPSTSVSTAFVAFCRNTACQTEDSNLCTPRLDLLLEQTPPYPVLVPEY